MLSAAELHERGRAASSAGRHVTARGLFIRAAQRADDADTSALVESSLAYVESELGNAEQGLLLIDAALARPSLSRGMEGIVRGQEALIHMRAGNGSHALEAFAAAIARLQDAPPFLGRAHLNRGNVYLQLGAFQQATDDFELAVQHFRVAGMEVQRAKALHNLGYTRLLSGHLIQALRVMDEARPVLAPLSPVSEAAGEQDRAEVLVAAGLTTEAEVALTNAIRAFGRRRLRQWQAEAELILARLLLVRDPARARVVALRASRRFRTRGSDTWALRTDAISIASRIESGVRDPAVAGDAVALAARLRERGLRQDAALLDLQAARALVRAGDTLGAHALLRRFRADSQTPLAARLLARQIRAELATAEGRRAHALHHIRTGLNELHEWQSAFGSLDLQSSLVGHGRRLAFDGIRLALDDGRPELVFEWSERARALVSRVTPIRPPSSAEAAADLAALRLLRTKAERDGVTLGEVRRQSELRERIRQRAWQDEGSGRVTEPLTLAATAAALATDDDALVAYLAVDDRLEALVVSADRADVVPLGTVTPVRHLLAGMQADLDMSASTLSPHLRTAVCAGLTDRLSLLADHLVTPIVKLVGDRRLVITPSGALAGTPWTMLPGLVGRPVTVPPSASLWVDRHNQPLVLDSAGFAAGPNVDRAVEELRSAESSWPRSTVLVGDDASSAGLRKLARTVDVLHVSAHGRHSADNPLFSGLELVDGPWFGYDIDQLDRIPPVVVLSACEVGRSAVRWGEEAIGMTAAWLHAGARCVIAAPASVNDDVACEVLSHTHRLLAAGVPPADALAEASFAHSADLGSPFLCFGSGW